MNSIVIGKHTLESLTTGMYSDAYVVFREYIQNSVDSIDEAIRSNILNSNEDAIVVCLSPTENKIIITDNGLGISEKEAEKALISIGNSKKSYDNSRGFRGIGRLSALSYCQKLTFITSFPGEEVATRISIDAAKLTRVLADDTQNDVTVVDVLESVYTITKKYEKEEAHYFKVIMDGIDSNSRLLSYQDVEDYLIENAPVAYRPAFVWGKEITNRLQKEGLTISCYNITLEYGNKTVPIYKAYGDEFVVDKNKNIVDSIKDIKILRFAYNEENIIAMGWMARTKYKGSIYDKQVKGLRLRKGNILIGDYQTMNAVFKDARFNGWVIGEIFALDRQLVPNARRDNFEKNSTYFYFFEQLKALAADITKNIRTASLRRNAELSNAFKKVNAVKKEAVTALKEGTSSTQKGIVSRKIREAKIAVSNSRVNGKEEEYYQDIAFEELDILTGKFKGITKYKALNIMENLTNTEKQILERVIKAIDSMQIKNADAVIEAVLNEFSEKER